MLNPIPESKAYLILCSFLAHSKNLIKVKSSSWINHLAESILNILGSSMRELKKLKKGVVRILEEPKSSIQYLFAKVMNRSDRKEVLLGEDNTKLNNLQASKESNEKLINVPDDGNCLFYCIAIGLKKNYKDEKDIQQKLEWDVVSPEELTGDLSKTMFLETVGGHLRKQANNLLLERNDIPEGVYGAADIADKQMEIKEVEETISYFKQNKPENYETLIKICEEDIEKMKGEIALLGSNENYINRTKEDKTLGGESQISALSLYYNIPITVVSHHGESQEAYEVTYNADSPLPPLKIDLEGKHYRVIDSQYQTDLANRTSSSINQNPQ
jgi:hypothetical protein